MALVFCQNTCLRGSSGALSRDKARSDFAFQPSPFQRVGNTDIPNIRLVIRVVANESGHLPSLMRRSDFIFEDRHGKRWRFFLIGAAIFSTLALLGTGVFFLSLFIAPGLKPPTTLDAARRTIEAAVPNRITESKFIPQESPSPPGPAAAPLPLSDSAELAAILPLWSKPALDSLEKHKDSLSHVCIEWMGFTDSAQGPSEKAGADPKIIERLKEENLSVLLILDNALGDERIPEPVENLSMAPRAEQLAFAKTLAESLQQVGADGVLIDWAEVDHGLARELSALVATIADQLHANGLTIWVCIPLDQTFPQWDFPLLERHVDRFVALFHDEHGEFAPPGPLASQDWTGAWIDRIKCASPKGKWIASLGTHALDWREGGDAAERITFQTAMSRASNAGCENFTTDAPWFNGTFSYYHNGNQHTVWFLDAVSFENQRSAILSSGFSGILVDRLGGEDSTIWRDRKNTRSMDPLEIPGGGIVASIGDGEVVTLDPTILSGSRTISRLPSGMLTALYHTAPSHPTLFKMGADADERVCLTFDDGPDPEWTPAILDILKDRSVKATFFIVGSRAERYPEIVRRIVAEGHEIGNHSFTHPNLATVPITRIKLELNATQRLIESLTGYSTTLFRPPYAADANPADPSELIPIAVAQDLGYMTVLESIDPKDWQEQGVASLVDRVKAQRSAGHIILLHDGGGDRSTTVAALPDIIDFLEERGDRIVTIAGLLDMDPKVVMPPVAPESEPAARLASGTGFQILHFLQKALGVFLLAASALVILRTLLVIALAWKHRRLSAFPPGAGKPVSILIPAHNEEKVIARTIRALLSSDYAGQFEIVVVDDGSTDNTAAEVLSIDDPKVRLLRQPNLGKAQALQHGLLHSSGEVIVFVDADTQFDRAAISHLVGHFADPAIGAVSGQARVGNLCSLLARWQDLEYVCNFNLDRRAYATWNCITVVPGAISAIRRSAIEDAGGFSSDTLAEDTDLTLQLHRTGWAIAYEPRAVARTEAPESLRQFAKQRFRWAFGTLQCVWKHRDLAFNPRFKALGLFSLPGIWFFQIMLVAVSPIVDLLMLQSLLLGNFMHILPYFLAFLLSDLLLAAFAVWIEGQPPRNALHIIPQRFICRPVLAYVIWRSILHAIRGAWIGWGKIPRTASVQPI